MLAQVRGRSREGEKGGDAREKKVGGSYGIRRWVWRRTRGLQNLSAVMGGERSHALCARNRALVEMYSVTSKVNMGR